MKTGKLICYTMGPEATAVERNRVRKLFWGYTDFSNKGQYRYFRKGVLSEVPHIKLIRAVIIVRDDDCDNVVDFLKNQNAIIFVKTVILSSEDEKELGIIE